MQVHLLQDNNYTFDTLPSSGWTWLEEYEDGDEMMGGEYALRDASPMGLYIGVSYDPTWDNTSDAFNGSIDLDNFRMVSFGDTSGLYE